MHTVQPITAFDRPELQPYATMRRHVEHREHGIFVAEGEKVVRRLLESPLTVLSLLVPEKWYHDLEPLIRARPENVQVFLAEKKLLETLTGFSMYQGLLAVGKVPRQPSLEEAFHLAPQPRLFAAVDSLSSAENMGAVVRNCAALHVSLLIVGETSSSPYLRRAVRSSMGTIFQQPVLETKSLVSTLSDLKQRGMRCIAAHPHVSGRTLPQAELKSDCCIVLGSEGYGISQPVLDACDDAVAVPMPPTIDSLNVASAAAVFLYETNRQRGRYGTFSNPTGRE
jgi:tRNA G18 (ribose-2'-O)-methylase SpoU